MWVCVFVGGGEGGDGTLLNANENWNSQMLELFWSISFSYLVFFLNIFFLFICRALQNHYIIWKATIKWYFWWKNQYGCFWTREYPMIITQRVKKINQAYVSTTNIVLWSCIANVWIAIGLARVVNETIRLNVQIVIK